MNTNYIAIFILILFFVSILVWLYEGTIAPTLRMVLRNEIFILRDILRKKYSESEIEKDEYEFLEMALNLTIQNSKKIDIILLGRVFNSIAKDNSQDEKTEKLFKKLYSNQFTHNIMKKHREIISKLIFINSFFAICIFSPIITPCLIFRRTLVSVGIIGIKRIESLKPKDIEKIYPNSLSVA